MDKKLSKLVAIMLVTTMLVGVLPLISLAKAQVSPLSFWVEPASVSFTTANASVGTLFNVTVYAACLDFTYAWQLNLGFNASLIQVVKYGLTAVSTSMLFAGHITLAPSTVDNVRGSFLAGETLIETDYLNASSNSLMWIEFKVTASPATNQTLTCEIDPAYGLTLSHVETYILNRNLERETPLSTAPCLYTFASTPSAVPPQPRLPHVELWVLTIGTLAFFLSLELVGGSVLLLFLGTLRKIKRKKKKKPARLYSLKAEGWSKT